MRIAWFTDTLGDINGVSRFIRNMGQQAANRGCAVSVITSTRLPTPDLPTVINFEPLYAATMPRYEQLEFVLPPVRKMLRHVERFRPDVVHVSTPGAVGLVGLRAARRFRLPLLGTYHTDFPAYIDHLLDDSALTWLCTVYMKWFYGRCARVFSRSRAFEGAMHRVDIGPERIESLRSGIDLQDFGPQFRDHAVWQRLGIARPGEPAPVRALYVGRVSVEKNLPLLTRTWKNVFAVASRHGRLAELIIVGDGPYLTEMRATLSGHSARFLGFRHGSELASIYASSDFFLFPSLTDTLGQSVMEAQASGLPAIVSDQGGPSSIVTDGVTGRVLPGADPGAWTQATLGLIRDNVARAGWSAAAIESMRGRDISTSFDHFWEVCERARHAHTAASASELRASAPCPLPG